jgi:hypothetical protein
MTASADLAAELEQVTSPASGGFVVRPVPSAPGYSIGRGEDAVVVLLTPPDDQPDPPTRLKSLTLEPRIHLVLEQQGARPVKEERGLVSLRLADPEILDPFLAVAAALVRLLGPMPAPGEVSAGMRRLVKVFDRTEAPRGSVLGLFGELVVIATSKDPRALVDAWHVRVDEKFDFAAAGSRLEVKTTTKGVREHMFGLRQLKPVPGADVRIASIMTTETSAGTSIGDLVTRVEAALGGDADRQVKVHQQVAMTLGSDWPQYLSHSFDEVQAAQSLVVLDPLLVPQVEDPPIEVVAVTLTVDCSHVPVDPAPVGLGALVRSPTS